MPKNLLNFFSKKNRKKKNSFKKKKVVSSTIHQLEERNAPGDLLNLTTMQLGNMRLADLNNPSSDTDLFTSDKQKTALILPASDLLTSASLTSAFGVVSPSSSSQASSTQSSSHELSDQYSVSDDDNLDSPFSFTAFNSRQWFGVSHGGAGLLNLKGLAYGVSSAGQLNGYVQQTSKPPANIPAATQLTSTTNAQSQILDARLAARQSGESLNRTSRSTRTDSATTTNEISNDNDIDVIQPTGITFGNEKLDTKVENQPGLSFTQTEIIVELDSSLTKTEVLAKLQTVNVADAQKVVSIDKLFTLNGMTTYQVNLSANTDPVQLIDELSRQNLVSSASPNYVVFNGKDWTPNDPDYTAAGQYYHTKSGTNLAWDITKGLPNILVGVADDGVGFNHPDLADNIWSNPNEIAGDGLDNDNNGFIDDVRGWDFQQNDGSPLPDGADTHGTHVSGIIAARNNNASGIAGTAGGDASNPNPSGARIVALRWDGPNGWTAARVAQTYAYAADNGVKIVNASYNFDAWVTNGVPNTVVNNALNYAHDKGVLLLNSSGNSGTLGAPRSVFNQPLFVASADKNDVRSSFSNHGSYVDVTGHGSGILSTTTSANGTGVNFEVFDGTSMSTPHAAGVAALIWSQNPNWTRDQVAAQLVGTADNIDAIPGNSPNTLGSGRVNAFRGVTEALAAPKFTNFNLNSTGNSFNSFSVMTQNRLNPQSVVTANFELKNDGLDNIFGTSDDQVFPVVINKNEAYKIGTNELTFTSSSGALPTDRYRFTALSGTSKIRDPFDNALDGDANGTAGGDFVREFGFNPQIAGTIYEDFNGNGQRNSFDQKMTGQTVFVDSNNNSIFDLESKSFSTNVPVNIVDNTTVFSDVVVSGYTGKMTDVNLKLNITHTFDADLDVFLVNPAGETVTLFSAIGGAGDNFTNTVLDHEASKLISAGTAPFTGTFKPTGDLSKFYNADPNGTWRLKVSDTASGDVGQILNWEISFAQSEPFSVTDTDGNYLFSGLPNGTHSIRSISPGWSNTSASNHSVTISSPADSFTSRDFGIGKNNRFYGFVWDDKNANGIQEQGELPVSNKSLFLDLNNNGTLESESVFTNTIPVNILDNTTVTSVLAVSGISDPIADVDVSVDITHTFDGDLNVFLISPSGKRVELFTSIGGAGDNFTGTILDDEAAIGIGSGTAPFTGRFRPEGLLADFDGLSANGNWTLEIRDGAGGDVGTLNKWDIRIVNEPSALTNSDGYAVFDLTGGQTKQISLLSTAGLKFTTPSNGKYTVTASGSPIYNSRYGIAESIAPTVSGITITPSGNQRSKIDKLTVSFNEVVNFPSTITDAFTLSKVGGGSVSLNATVDHSSGASVVTITFADNTTFNHLNDGDFNLVVNAAKINDIAQNQMAADKSQAFYRLFGDSNGDRIVNGLDWFLFRQAIGKDNTQAGYQAYFDYNNDSKIDATDRAEFNLRYGKSI